MSTYAPGWRCHRARKARGQTVLGRGPIQRQIGFGKNLEGGAGSGHSVSEQRAAFFSGGAHREFLKRAAKIVLGPGPIQGQIRLGPDFEGGAISGYSVFEQFAAFVCAAARPAASRGFFDKRRFEMKMREPVRERGTGNTSRYAAAIRNICKAASAEPRAPAMSRSGTTANWTI